MALTAVDTTETELDREWEIAYNSDVICIRRNFYLRNRARQMRDIQVEKNWPRNTALWNTFLNRHRLGMFAITQNALDALG